MGPETAEAAAQITAVGYLEQALKRPLPQDGGGKAQVILEFLPGQWGFTE
jgi:hypothetical protein